MDYQYTRNDRHSQRMETLSLIMGVIALVTMCTVYPTLICGSLGIVFALLSRGGEFSMQSRAKDWRCSLSKCQRKSTGFRRCAGLGDGRDFLQTPGCQLQELDGAGP